MKKDSIPKILFRFDNEMEHLVIQQNGLLVSDECEGFPKLSSMDVLNCLVSHGLIELEVEEIKD